MRQVPMIFPILEMSNIEKIEAVNKKDGVDQKGII